MATARLENNSPTFHLDRHLIAGRYRTLSRIGQGRLGSIFAAIDESYGNLGVEQRVAIQIIPENIVGNNKLFNKLNVGYTLLKAGDHPNIVSLLDFGRDARIGYVAMELLEGASLRVLLDDAEMLALEEAKPVIRGAGEALLHLQAKDMVHGNVTSKNVFITEELDVRLLDIVPLDAANAIFRGAAVSEPFGRCTVADDVFGLACLAYEMLAGKHPFNYNPPTEARLAGLKAGRIDGLGDSEWNALQRALSFDREQRTSSVADFMREFGINGAERLRASAEQVDNYESVPHAAMELLPPLATMQRSVTTAPAVDHDAIALQENWPPDARPYQEQKRPVRAVFLGLVLAALSTWMFLGQPQEQFTNMFSYVEKVIDVGLAGREDVVVDVQTTDADLPVTTERKPVITEQAIAMPVAAADADQADPETTQPATAVANTSGESAANLEQPTSEPEISMSSQDESPAVANDETPVYEPPVLEPANDVAGSVSTNTETDLSPLQTETATVVADAVASEPGRDSFANNSGALQTESRLVVTDPVITVSEAAGVARIVLQRNRNSATPLIWWTIGNTAHVDADFIPVNRQIVPDPSSEDGTVLHVPLVNDGLAEPQESFFVNFGIRDVETGKIEEVAAVRVDIIDDDFR